MNAEGQNSRYGLAIRVFDALQITHCGSICFVAYKESASHRPISISQMFSQQEELRF